MSTPTPERRGFSYSVRELVLPFVSTNSQLSSKGRWRSAAVRLGNLRPESQNNIPTLIDTFLSSITLFAPHERTSILSKMILENLDNTHWDCDPSDIEKVLKYIPLGEDRLQRLLLTKTAELDIVEIRKILDRIKRKPRASFRSDTGLVLITGNPELETKVEELVEFKQKINERVNPSDPQTRK